MNLLEIQPADVARAAAGLRPGERSLVADLRALLHYAQTGALGEAEAWECFTRAMPLLFAGPGEIDFDAMHAKLKTPDEIAAPDAARAVAVMRAARGRLSLAREQRIAAGDMAALLGVDASLIRRMVRQGKLQRVSIMAPRARAVSAPVRPHASRVRTGPTHPGRNAPITMHSALEELKRRGIKPFGGST